MGVKQIGIRKQITDNGRQEAGQSSEKDWSMRERTMQQITHSSKKGTKGNRERLTKLTRKGTWNREKNEHQGRT